MMRWVLCNAMVLLFFFSSNYCFSQRVKEIAREGENGFLISSGHNVYYYESYDTSIINRIIESDISKLRKLNYIDPVDLVSFLNKEETSIQKYYKVDSYSPKSVYVKVYKNRKYYIMNISGLYKITIEKKCGKIQIYYSPYFCWKIE